MAKTVESKITKMLMRYDDDMDSEYGKSLINDFLQLSKILEKLNETDKKAFTAMYALIEENLGLKVGFKERGNRIHKLSKGQLQPKGTGKKRISTNAKRTEKNN